MIPVRLIPRTTMFRPRALFVLIAMWAGANFVAVWLIDLYETSQLAEEFHVPATTISQFETRTVTLDSKPPDRSVSLRYRLRTPSMWAGARTTPLLVFLHSSGERGFENVRQLGGPVAMMCELTLAEGLSCAILVPQCPDGMSWSSKVNSDHDMLNVVLKMIDDVVQDDRISIDQIYVAGYSMGASGAWELAARSPKRFAAVVPIAGGAGEKLAEQLSTIPVWAVHSADDEVVSVDGTRKIVDAIRKAGGSPKYLELTNAGHGAWRDVFRADSPVLEWMFQQRSSSHSVE